MQTSLEQLGIDRLSVNERIALVQDIWDSVAETVQAQPPSDAQRAELDRRLAEDDLQPDDTTDWEAIKGAARHRWAGE
jgi:putative addiction module component (TIGR02574 family)